MELRSLIPSTESMESDQEIDLLVIWRRLMRYKALLVGLPVSFVLVANIACFFARPQWEAQVLVEPGRIIKPDQSTELLESIKDMVARAQSANFKAAVIAKVSHDAPELRSDLYAGSLTAIVPSSSNHLRLTLRAFSREEALAWANATVDHLAEAHQEQLAANRKSLTDQLTQIDKQIERVQAALSAGSRQGQAAGGFEGLGPAFRKASLVGQLEVLLEARTSCAYRIAPEFNYLARMRDPIFAGVNAVYPNRLRLSALAALLGLAAGLLLSFVLEARASGELSGK